MVDGIRCGGGGWSGGESVVEVGSRGSTDGGESLMPWRAARRASRRSLLAVTMDGGCDLPAPTAQGKASSSKRTSAVAVMFPRAGSQTR